MKYLKYLLAVSAFVLPFLVYFKTLAPTYVSIDNAEITLCMHYWGVCHPPGFPLYTFLGHIFMAVFSSANKVFQANLLSAIFGAGTIFVLYIGLLRIGLDKIIAFGWVLVLAFSSIFWEYSISADVFTFGTFLLSLSLYFAFLSRPIFAFLVLGFSASHFYISTILVPIYIWYFLGFPQKENFKKYFLNLVVWGLVFVTGFFAQLIMFWRMLDHPAISWGHVQSFSGFVDFVRRREFGSFFLLSNPVLQFSLLKVVKHFWAFFQSVVLQLGYVAPFLALIFLIFKRVFKQKDVKFLLLSFAILTTVQLVLLSTIDPVTDGDFPIPKFYLFSFSILILLFGYGLINLKRRLFQENTFALSILFFALAVIALLSNFRTQNYSKNYYSQELVLAALSQLPEGSVAITLDHLFYFGSRYEQEVNGNNGNIRLAYFINENNKDVIGYLPELYQQSKNEEFVNKIIAEWKLGNSERFVVDTLASNFDKQIFIRQGDFEETFFGFLKPYLKPYGFWWKFEPDENQKYDPNESYKMLAPFLSKDLTLGPGPFHQKKDQAVYLVTFHSTAKEMARVGKYDEAIALFEAMIPYHSKPEEVRAKASAVFETKELEGRREELGSSGDIEKLFKLATNYFSLGNFQKAAEIYEIMLPLDPDNAQLYNNLASSYASYGNFELAKLNYQKALKLDPNMKLAKDGLERIEKGEK